MGIVLFSACSVTKHLPEDEILYTGGKTVIVNKSSTRVGETALTEINAVRLPKLPVLRCWRFFCLFLLKCGCITTSWNTKKGFGKWMFNRFAANPPVFISTVNPEVRVKVAANLLRDYGYFNGKVTYETLVDKKDSLKASLLYTVDMKNPYFIDTVYYQRFTPQTLKIMERGRRMSYITPANSLMWWIWMKNVPVSVPFCVIGDILLPSGLYDLSGRYNLGSRWTYQSSSDSLPGLPAAAQRSYYVGDASVYLFGKNGRAPNDSILYKNLNIHYYNKLQVRPNMLYRWMNYQQFVRNANRWGLQTVPVFIASTGRSRCRRNLASWIFQLSGYTICSRDTTAACDTLDVTELHLPNRWMQNWNWM